MKTNPKYYIRKDDNEIFVKCENGKYKNLHVKTNYPENIHQEWEARHFHESLFFPLETLEAIKNEDI